MLRWSGPRSRNWASAASETEATAQSPVSLR